MQVKTLLEATRPELSSRRWPASEDEMPSSKKVRLASPMQADREYDMPGSPHAGRSAALRVPCSQGPASKVFDRGAVPDTELIRQEPQVFPHRLMETKKAPVEVKAVESRAVKAPGASRSPVGTFLGWLRPASV